MRSKETHGYQGASKKFMPLPKLSKVLGESEGTFSKVPSAGYGAAPRISLNIQILSEFGVFLDELPAGIHLVAHED